MMFVHLLIISVIACSSAVNAWGADGHKSVAAVAMKFLNPTTQNAVSDILGGSSLEDIATWADDIKHTAAYSWSGPLHYINTADFECGFNRATDCSNGLCLATAIDNYTSLLSSGQDMTESVKFLTHFLGDLTQPLHVGFGSDEGGNTLHGYLQGKYVDFHTMWDSTMINERVANDFSGSFDSFTQYLVARVSAGGDMYNQISSFTTCTSDCVDVWASEAAANNCKYVYVDDNGNKITNGFNLGDQYYQTNIQNIEYMLIEGGIRLAHVLNQAIAQANYANVALM
jgi:hypothetical protein